MCDILDTLICKLGADETDRHADTRVGASADIKHIFDFGVHVVGTKDSGLAERMCESKCGAFECIVVCNEVSDAV